MGRVGGWEGGWEGLVGRVGGREGIFLGSSREFCVLKAQWFFGTDILQFFLSEIVEASHPIPTNAGEALWR